MVKAGRRHFVVFGVCTLLFGTRRDAAAAAPRVGIVWQVAAPFDTTLAEALRSLGYTPGLDVFIDWRVTDNAETSRALALELLALKVNVIVTGGTIVTREVLAANTHIPVVFVAGDPVGTGFVKSLSQPGGNATGVSSGPTDLSGKRLELLQRLVPRARHIGYLRNQRNPAQDLSLQEVLRVSRALKIAVEPLTASRGQELDAVMEQLPAKKLDALLVSGDVFFFKEREKIAKAIRRANLPAMFPLAEYHDSGALMSYGPSGKDIMKLVAHYVDRILKGADPSTLPVQQVSTFSFVLDLRVAHEMGISVPEDLLLRADEVIR
jgi:putative ABC transport system substrate-binding protein